MSRADEITSFTTIVDLGTFSAAAKELHMTTAGISRRIKSLEDRLGVKLIERTTRCATLTEAGGFYNKKVRKLMETMTELESDIQSLAHNPSGKIKVNAPPAFTESVLAEVLHKFTKSYPELKLEIHTSVNHINLDTENYDIAFRLTKSPFKGYENTNIGSIKYNVVASPSYICRHGKPKSLDDISTHNCLQFSHQAEEGKWSLSNRSTTTPVAVTGNLNTNCANVLLNSTLNGQGIAYMPDFIYQKHVREGNLEILLPEYSNQDSHLYAIHNDSILTSKKVNLIINFIKDKWQTNNNLELASI